MIYNQVDDNTITILLIKVNMEEMAKQIRQATADQAEFENKIKSPLLHLVPSVIVHIPLAAAFWPLDVIKNHIFAGKNISSGIKNQYSFKGIGFGMLSATLLGLDVSKVYVEQFCQNLTFRQKAAIGLAPLSLIPLGSVLDMLKINCQVSQLTMKHCLSSLIQRNGYLGLFKGLLPYTSLFGLTYAAIILPIFYSQKPSKGIPGMPDSEPEAVLINPAILLTYFILCTPLEMIKTRLMLGDKMSLSLVTKIPIASYAKCFAVRTCFVLIFGLIAAKGIEVTTLVAYSTKVSKYMETKKVETMSKMFADDDAFDELIPEDTEDLEPLDIIKKTVTKDG